MYFMRFRLELGRTCCLSTQFTEKAAKGGQEVAMSEPTQYEPDFTLRRGATSVQMATARERIHQIESRMAALSQVRAEEAKEIERELRLARLDLLNLVEEESFELVLGMKFGKQAQATLNRYTNKLGLTAEDRRRVVELKYLHATTVERIATLVEQGFSLTEVDNLLNVRDRYRDIDHVKGEYMLSVALLATVVRKFPDVSCDEHLADIVESAVGATGDSPGMALWRLIKCGNALRFQFAQETLDYLELEQLDHEQRWEAGNRIVSDFYEEERRRNQGEKRRKRRVKSRSEVEP